VTTNSRIERFFLAAATLGALAALGATSLPKAWTHWRYSRAIELPAADATRLASIVVPPDAYAHLQRGLGDVRVIDDAGAEVPYARFIRLGSKSAVSLPATLLENSFSAGHYTQLVLRIRRPAPFHNAVRIQTSQADYIEWVQVEASDDARIWRIVQERAPIFRFQKQGNEGTQTVPYSENNALYLRVRILDGEKQFPVTAATVLYQTSEPPERIPVEIGVVSDANPPAGRSSWIADFGAASIPVAEVRFEIPGKTEFIRAVQLSASNDRKEWSTFARGEIYRYHQAEKMQEHLAVSVPYAEPSGRYWRVEIVNGNDAPLEGATPHFYATPRHIIFEQQPGRSYRLIYGQYRAEAPQYDLERRLSTKREEAAVAGQTGPEEENADYSDPRPWTEQHAIFLWIVLGIVVVLLGYSAMRSLRRSAPPPNSGE
jgi:hypothetical protein